MIADADLLAQAPDFLSIGGLLKATPSVEGGRRFLFMEASNEGLDQTNEVVLAKALAEQAGFYKRYGNLDLDHFTVIGAKAGIPDYLSYEIGKPVDVAQRDGATFVKAEIFTGSGPMAEKANMVWDSIYKLKPAQRWYPSVGGAVLAKSLAIDPANGAKRTLITKVRWTNIGLSKTPANQHVPTASLVPMGTFAKSLMVGQSSGDDWTLTKMLTAGYGADSATLEGGAAMREQSLDGAKNSRGASRDGITYFDFRERLARAIRSGDCGSKPDSETLMRHAVHTFGLPEDQAAEHVERFVRDLSNGLSRRKTT
jgi:hypothetical protein